MFEEGEWVNAEMLSGDTAIGYIEQVLNDENRLIIRKFCANEKHGSRSRIWMNDAEKASVADISDTEGYLLNAIDFALDTSDKEEFFRRTSELRKLRGLRALPDPMTISAKL